MDAEARAETIVRLLPIADDVQIGGGISNVNVLHPNFASNRPIYISC